jgi:tRNA 5-methylaminomethyl-2-thiouridine biosynthesis bifunctional protein
MESSLPDDRPESVVRDVLADLSEKISRRIVVLDADFGSGERFGLFIARWQSVREPRGQLHYFAHSGCTAFPSAFDRDSAAYAFAVDELRAQWPVGVPGLHRLELFGGRVLLTMCFGSAEHCLTRLRMRADCIFAELSAGENNDRIAWMSRVFARLASKDASLHLFFNSERRSGCKVELFIQKFQASGFRGHFLNADSGNAAEWRAKFVAVRNSATMTIAERQSTNGAPLDRRAVVVGSGIAGTSVARSLAKRGWDVVLVDQCEGAAERASGNLAAVIMPMLSKDDGLAARLSRASFFQLLREIRCLNRTLPAVCWGQCGVVQLAESQAQESAFRELLRVHQYPPEYARYLDAIGAAGISGAEGIGRAAIFFPSGGWISPPSLCQARVATPGVQAVFGARVSALIKRDNQWLVVGDDGKQIAEAPVVVLANGYEATHLDQARHLRLKKVRGQVSHLRADFLPGISTVISGDGYLTPEFCGICSLGATYDFGLEETAALVASDQQNLGRLVELAPRALVPGVVAVAGARVGFRSLTADRLPIVGRLADVDALHGRKNIPERLDSIPRLPGVFSCLGMGSRGVVWSGMTGEILAAMIEGEPSPIEGDLLDALDPARFLLRDARRSLPASE